MYIYPISKISFCLYCIVPSWSLGLWFDVFPFLLLVDFTMFFIFFFLSFHHNASQRARQHTRSCLFLNATISTNQALAEEAPARLQLLFAAGLRQHKTLVRFLHDTAAACNEIAIAAASTSGTIRSQCVINFIYLFFYPTINLGVDNKGTTDACTAPVLHAIQAYATKLLLINDLAQVTWVNLSREKNTDSSNRCRNNSMTRKSS